MSFVLQSGYDDGEVVEFVKPPISLPQTSTRQHYILVGVSSVCAELKAFIKLLKRNWIEKYGYLERFE